MTYREAIDDQKRLVNYRARYFNNLSKTEKSIENAPKPDAFFPEFIKRNINSSNY